MGMETASWAGTLEDGVTRGRSLRSYVRMSGVAIAALCVCALMMLYVASSIAKRIDMTGDIRILLYLGLCMFLVSGYAFHVISVMAHERKILRDAEVGRQKALFEMVECLSFVIEARDSYTGGHQRRVAELARAIAEEMGLAPSVVASIELAATVHDIGKVHVPIDVLVKPGDLTGEERSMLEAHPDAGAQLIGKIGSPWSLADMVRQHHERLDGSGYGAGLTGDAILVEAKVLAVADVAEAMLAERPYRGPAEIGEVLQEISRQRGVLYDPAAVDACLSVFEGERFSRWGPRKAAESAVDSLQER